jgi:HK97 family phage major capsid protein
MAGALARAEAVTENTVATAILLTGATAATAAAGQAAITIAEIMRLTGHLTNGYNITGEAGFLMRNATRAYLQGVGMTNSQPWNFGGYPAWVSDDMEALATGQKATLFGNFNYFGVLERPGMLVQRNPYLYMATGQIGIFANIFRAYAVLQGEAFYTMAQA